MASKKLRIVDNHLLRVLAEREGKRYLTALEETTGKVSYVYMLALGFWNLLEADRNALCKVEDIFPQEYIIYIQNGAQLALKRYRTSVEKFYTGRYLSEVKKLYSIEDFYSDYRVRAYSILKTTNYTPDILVKNLVEKVESSVFRFMQRVCSLTPLDIELLEKAKNRYTTRLRNEIKNTLAFIADLEAQKSFTKRLESYDKQKI
ncbi:MAG: hypothetical protein DRN26_01560 [Thermoplasmata archaeon]|nr:MAG: hypothetical protein DRN26_01560 [Thermoplasmata archaeon]